MTGQSREILQKGVPDSGRSEKREQGKHGSVLDSSTAERIDKEQIMIQKRLGKELLFRQGASEQAFGPVRRARWSSPQLRFKRPAPARGAHSIV